MALRNEKCGLARLAKFLIPGSGFGFLLEFELWRSVLDYTPKGVLAESPAVGDAGPMKIGTRQDIVNVVSASPPHAVSEILPPYTSKYLHRMKHLYLLALVALPILPARANTYQWTNTLGGDFSAPANWSPNGVPSGLDTANITAPGTYTVTASNSGAFWGLNLGASSGTQTLLYGQSGVCGLSNLCTVKANGLLMVTNGGLIGSLTVEAGGQLQLSGTPSKLLYYFNLINQGTVTWSGGSLSAGSTTISNGGLWQITSDSALVQGGYATPTWLNSGTLRKSGGAATAYLTSVNFVNQPGGLVDVLSGSLQITGSGTNVLGGAFTATAPGGLRLFNSTWTDAGGTASGTGINQFSSGTLLLRTNPIPGLLLTGGDIYTTSTFQQAGTITNLTLDGATLRGTNTVNNGTLTINSGNILEQLTILPAGQLVFATSGSKLLYNSSIFNQGTVTWAAGSLSLGSTTISNGGLWEVAGNLAASYGGYATPNWTNTGILRKTVGSGVAQISGINFINQPGGLVDAQAGTVQFTGGNLSLLGGTFNATAPAVIEITGGTWSDAGGITTGTGTNRLRGGTFNLRTNTIPGLQFIAGSVSVTGTNTFQQAGAITNLTIDGASLVGTNRVGNGTLTVNSGSMAGRLTVESGGQLLLATAADKTLYSLTLLNQGTVQWSAGNLWFGSTPTTVVSNGGQWLMTSNNLIIFGGGATSVWTNNGTLRKSAGTGTSVATGVNFYNQSDGLVQVDTGTLQLTSITTNLAGTLRLNGGTLIANGTLAVGGGTLDGTGTVGANALSGGLISPGQGGAGLMSFASGLNLGSNATLTLDGTGTVPGTGYDQLSVTGAVALSNCVLQVTSLPTVVTGTVFVIINNDGADAVTGTFKGLPESAILPVNDQVFRVSYHGGTGNDVTLTRIENPQVTGQVALEGFLGATRAVVFTATDSGAAVLATWSNTLSFASGLASYALIVPVRTAALSAKTDWTLRTRLVVTIVANQAVANFTGANLLPAGDINGDNVVNAADYYQMAGAWYQMNPASDIDGSGRVGVEDYFLMANHWNEAGHAP